MNSTATHLLDAYNQPSGTPYPALTFDWNPIVGYKADMRIVARVFALLPLLWVEGVLASDTDGDGVEDDVDNCPLVATADQTDTDNDGLGNACDADDDGDSIPDSDELALGLDLLVPDYMVEAGLSTSCAIVDIDGDSEPMFGGMNQVTCWESIPLSTGQTNIIDLSNTTNPPPPLQANERWISLSGFAGTFCGITLAISANNRTRSLKCFSVGDEPYDGEVEFFNQLPHTEEPLLVSVGAYHGCVVDSRGLQCWGRNLNTDLVPNLDNVAYISSGLYVSCAIANKELVCWGEAPSWMNPVVIPDEAFAFSEPFQVDFGYNNACLANRGELFCWNLYSGAFTQANTSPLSSIAITNEGSACGIYQISELACGDTELGGWPSYYYVEPPSSVSRASQVAGGYRHFCALHELNVSCWGYTAGISEIMGDAPVSLLIDPDGDGVSSQRGADRFPFDGSEWSDTDLDGIGNNADADDDDDGLSDVNEAELGTDPLKRDTDGDGWSDKEEVDEGTDPLLATSQPELEGGLPIWLLYQATQ